jgi:hypothetical protein
MPFHPVRAGFGTLGTLVFLAGIWALMRFGLNACGTSECASPAAFWGLIAAFALEIIVLITAVQRRNAALWVIAVVLGFLLLVGYPLIAVAFSCNNLGNERESDRLEQRLTQPGQRVSVFTANLALNQVAGSTRNTGGPDTIQVDTTVPASAGFDMRVFVSRSKKEGDRTLRETLAGDVWTSAAPGWATPTQPVTRKWNVDTQAWEATSGVITQDWTGCTAQNNGSTVPQAVRPLSQDEYVSLANLTDAAVTSTVTIPIAQTTTPLTLSMALGQTRTQEATDGWRYEASLVGWRLPAGPLEVTYVHGCPAVEPACQAQVAAEFPEISDARYVYLGERTPQEIVADKEFSVGVEFWFFLIVVFTLVPIAAFGVTSPVWGVLGKFTDALNLGGAFKASQMLAVPGVGTLAAVFAAPFVGLFQALAGLLGFAVGLAKFGFVLVTGFAGLLLSGILVMITRGLVRIETLEGVGLLAGGTVALFVLALLMSYRSGGKKKNGGKKRGGKRRRRGRKRGASL